MEITSLRFFYHAFEFVQKFLLDVAVWRTKPQLNFRLVKILPCQNCVQNFDSISFSKFSRRSLRRMRSRNLFWINEFLRKSPATIDSAITPQTDKCQLSFCNKFVYYLKKRITSEKFLEISDLEIWICWQFYLFVKITQSVKHSINYVNPKSRAVLLETQLGEFADWASHFSVQRWIYRARRTRHRNYQKAAEEGREFIVACGGDGTINEVANGIMLSEKDAGTRSFAKGTGGDFRRTLGLPSTIRRSAEELKTEQPSELMLEKVTFQKSSKSNWRKIFLNIASVGLSASIIERVKTTGKLDWLAFDSLRGKSQFCLFNLYKKFGIYTPKRFASDLMTNLLKPLQTIVFCVANARYFGGGMKIAPDAVIDDGKFDVGKYRRHRHRKNYAQCAKLYAGTHYSMEEVKHRNAKKIGSFFLQWRRNQHRIDGELPEITCDFPDFEPLLCVSLRKINHREHRAQR